MNRLPTSLVRIAFLSLAWSLSIAVGLAEDSPVVVEIRTKPGKIELGGRERSASIQVDGKTADGRWIDLTHDARVRVADAGIAKIEERRWVAPVRNGETTAVVEAGGKSVRIPVVVKGADEPRAYHFENDIVPLLNRHGCNSSGCHAKSGGQNGFQVSVFGSDPMFDYAAMVKENRGRRLMPASPEHSLLLLKASGRTPHGGGIRIRPGTVDYQTIRGWIAAGAPLGDPKAPSVVGLRVSPTERALAMGSLQQLRVTALWSDGAENDVTKLARFSLNSEGLASVDEDGLVTAGRTPGDVAAMATFQGQVAVFRALIPRPGKSEPYPPFERKNFIDDFTLARWKKLNVAPSGLSSDAEFLRRAYLDIVGVLPTPAEARRFLADKSLNKRESLIDDLLDRPEFVDLWALYWADALRVDRQALGTKQAYSYYRWIRDRIASRQPFDAFARELVSAEGPLDESPAGSFFKAVPKPGEAASTLSQVFLGVRIACAECHHHPFDRWSQEDYLGVKAFFTQVKLERTARGEGVMAAGDGAVTHPRTGAIVPAHGLADSVKRTDHAASDRRKDFAAWLARPENPWFARNLANRLWAKFFGRGLVEPIDDVRESNPPSNPELLDALAREVVAQKFDLRKVIRTIVLSRTYQLSSATNATNEKDHASASRSLLRRIDAEVLLDMVSQTTGVPEQFRGSPPGTRAVQQWDSKLTHYFLKIYGRPQRSTACSCERVTEPSVSQVLHLLNSPEIHEKVTSERGAVAQAERTIRDDGKLAEELYLTFYSRLPSTEEMRTASEYLRRGNRRQAAEDLAWALMNTVEFVFNH